MYERSLLCSPKRHLFNQKIVINVKCLFWYLISYVIYLISYWLEQYFIIIIYIIKTYMWKNVDRHGLLLQDCLVNWKLSVLKKSWGGGQECLKIKEWGKSCLYFLSIVIGGFIWTCSSWNLCKEASIHSCVWSHRQRLICPFRWKQNRT